MHYLDALLALASLASTALSHGILTSPYPRAIGASSLSACGPTVQANIAADNTSHVEGLPEAAATDPAYNASACNLWLCRGLQYADNTANVQSWTVGQVVAIEAYIRVLHHGTANVSIVDTQSNTIVGGELLYWGDYADETLTTLPANNTAFSVTIPELGGKCTVAGECVLQWWWYGTGVKQTYESCLDFTVAPAASTIPRFRFWRY
ncbi:hypothetical protein LHYA1_G002674 [Lachnellula hyalina]|uniref:Chitin-binding type-4 domain-containing protein n=1 Tax=Lachnellula hyalina TaxID=1316788 RepID=A0A8H8R7Q4_9HELO|nr:uncharacterized protein LHYA1_G002674 [Lachnellula hyalina]TVY29151.1 hypothetical protein LHYA1_G002674 [Lachnellula hyalina]